MKRRKKYFAVEFVTDVYLNEVEFTYVHAESEEEAEVTLRRLFGEHFVGCSVRPATFRERRFAKKYPYDVITA